MTWKETLQRFGQEHLLQFEKELDAAQVEALHRQLESIDFEQLRQLTSDHAEATDWGALAARAQQPPAVRLGREHPEWNQAAAIAAGEAALRTGKVGMILVAGGQGTRLGFDKPKGMFPVGPLSKRTLFQMHCDRLLAVMQRFGVSIPLLVMTSPATDQATRDYFTENERCGLNEDQLIIFCQGTMPAVDDQNGKVLLESKHSVALSPDGHGGLVEALHKNGCLDLTQQRGIEHFFYAQVDNPLVEVCDPELIGFHLLAGSEMTTQVVKKRFPMEKVGNVVEIDGKVQIIEYSDLPEEAAQLLDEQGELKLWAGNIAVHVIDREFLQRVVASPQGLPFHRAHKAVPYIDRDGKRIEPQQPNAIKFEKFVFDLLPLAKHAIVVEADPVRVFAPVKNANGSEVDTPQHTQEALLALHRQWLTQAGVEVDEGIRVEIHPDWALDAAEVKSKARAGLKLNSDTFLR